MNALKTGIFFFGVLLIAAWTGCQSIRQAELESDQPFNERQEWEKTPQIPGLEADRD